MWLSSTSTQFCFIYSALLLRVQCAHSSLCSCSWIKDSVYVWLLMYDNKCIKNSNENVPCFEGYGVINRKFKWRENKWYTRNIEMLSNRPAGKYKVHHFKQTLGRIVGPLSHSVPAPVFVHGHPQHPTTGGSVSPYKYFAATDAIGYHQSISL